MTVIMTCCKVVYCKSSNPYEKNRYPYLIGAHFVNLTAEDNELLNTHVDRRRKQQLVVNGSIFALLTAVLVAPDQALGLLEALGHYLLVTFLHMLHLLFEYLEQGLDHIVEHFFHTGTHETQVIVFYILVSLGFTVLYFLGRKVPAAYTRLSSRLLLYGARKKSSCLYYWGEQTLANKIKIIGISTAAIASYIYFAI